MNGLSGVQEPQGTAGCGGWLCNQRQFTMWASQKSVSHWCKYFFFTDSHSSSLLDWVCNLKLWKEIFRLVPNDSQDTSTPATPETFVVFCQDSHSPTGGQCVCQQLSLLRPTLMCSHLTKPHMAPALPVQHKWLDAKACFHFHTAPDCQTSARQGQALCRQHHHRGEIWKQQLLLTPWEDEQHHSESTGLQELLSRELLPRFSFSCAHIILTLPCRLSQFLFVLFWSYQGWMQQELRCLWERIFEKMYKAMLFLHSCISICRK